MLKKLIAFALVLSLFCCVLPFHAMAYEPSDLKRIVKVGCADSDPVPKKTGITYDDVTMIQERLSNYKFYTGAVDGFYSQAVADAVIEFQRANNLKADGKVGSKTWKKLCGDNAVNKDNAENYAQSDLKRTISYGCKDTDKIGKTGNTYNDVSTVQVRLQYYGFYEGEITGSYGNNVKQAVIAFQKANGLKADGKVGPNTWAMLIADTSAHKGDDPKASTIRKGDTGDLVKTAQQRLAYYGFWEYDITSEFTYAMEVAVRKFQLKNDLTTDGVIGTKTWDILNGSTGKHYSDTTFETIEYGAKGDLVKDIQVALKNYYYYTGTIDGEFDDDVLAAVRRFQESNGMTVDGKVGQKTWDALVNGTADIFKSGAMTKVELSIGMRGYDVYIIQQKLTQLNFYTGLLNGYFDSATQSAVIAFQKKNNIEETGTVNAKTRRYIWPGTVAENEDTDEDGNKIDDSKYPKLKLGSHGSTVSNAQIKLKSAGYLLGNADGIFGEKTQKAVIAFQKANNIKADGIIGEETWQLLNKIDSSYTTPEVEKSDETATGVPTRKLYQGCSGSQVSWLQNKLATLGYMSSADVDGKFGPITAQAVMDFQTAEGLTADGIAGTKTYARIYELTK